MKRRRPGLLLALFIASGCSSADVPDLCAAEKYQCENHSDGWHREPRCELDGQLEVELGQGETTFEAIAEDSLPIVFNGAQGGKHVFLGVRVTNPALDRYETLRVDYQLVFKLQSGACAGGAVGTGGAECEFVVGARELVLGKSQPMRVIDGSIVEEFGLLVFLESEPEGVWQLRLTVEDPCGRSAIIRRDVIHGATD